MLSLPFLVSLKLFVTLKALTYGFHLGPVLLKTHVVMLQRSFILLKLRT